MNSFKHGEITEFVQWYDTDGNIINASDGGVIFAEGKYHSAENLQNHINLL